MITDISESFQSPVKYAYDNEKSGPFHQYYIFTVNGNNYRVNISRISSPAKTSYMLNLGMLSPKGSMVQFKYTHADIYPVISTTLAIFEEWFSVHKNTFTSIVIKLPSKIKLAQVKIIENLIRRQKYPNLEKIIMSGIGEAKHKYIFYKNTKKPDDAVLISLFSKSFEEYGFKDGFPAELVDSLMLKTKASKSHLIDRLELLVKGHSEFSATEEIFKKTSAQEVSFLEQSKEAITIIEQNEDDVETTDAGKKDDPKPSDIEYHWNLPIGLRKKVQALNNFLAKLGVERLPKLIDWVSKENQEARFDHIGVFYQAIAEEFPKWEINDTEKNSLFLADAFFSIPTDYIKYLNFHTKKQEQYALFTPYVFFAEKKLATTKLSNLTDGLIKDSVIINSFYSRLTSDLSNKSNIGKITVDNTTVHMFHEHFKRWQYVNFLKDNAKEGNYPKSILESLSSNSYYDLSEVEKAQLEKIKNSDLIELAFIDTKGIQIPAPKNNIFDYSSVEKYVDELYDFQKTKANPNKLEAINTYTASGYNYINGGLRDKEVGKKRKEGVLKFLKEFKEYSVKLPFDIEVSRKTNFPATIELEKTYVDYSPLSTSLLSSVWSGSQKMKILVPKGTPVFLALKGFSNHSGEKEVILPPGSIIKPYRLIKLSNSSDKWYECICLGNIFNHVYDTMQNIDLEKPEEDFFDMDFDVVDENNTITSFESFMQNFVTEQVGQEQPKTTKSKEEMVEEEILFGASEEVLEMIKNGSVKPNYYFERM